jgi:EAL domain-containing protein (putative c-di-GMP-specific phosphodiesterase class I)
MIEQCEYLRSQGLRLAIDDFGAGISNLSMLEIMKPSYIKISGRFIKNSHLDERKKKIIKNILDLAKDFDIIPIVESVESSEEWRQVIDMGARMAQGFYFFRPMDQENLNVLLKNRK